MDVHLRLLRYFVAVAEEQSFSAAADRLHVSQPALSRQIRQLENELRVRLLDRHPRGARLTPAGRQLLADAPAVLRDWQRAHAAVGAAAADTTSVRVGFTAANTTGFARPVIAAFGGAHPGWRVVMVQAGWDDPTAVLRSREVDVAFLRHPLPDTDQLDHLDLYNEPRVLALPASHRLADRRSVDFTDILDETFVPLPEGPWRDYWLCLDQRAGHPIRLTDPVTGPEEWSAAISAGRGIAVTAASAADYYARPGLAFRPLRGVTATTIAVVWRRDDTRDKVRSFVYACRTTMTPPPPPSPPTTRVGRPTADNGPPTLTGLRQPPQSVRFATSSAPDPLQDAILAAFRSAAESPGAEHIASDSTASRVQALLDRTADVAFVRLVESPDTHLAYQSLRTEQLLLAVHYRHPLAERIDHPGIIALHDLDQQPLAFYHREQNPWWHDQTLQQLAEHHAQPIIIHRGLWIYDLLPLVNAGTASALIGRSTATTLALPHVRYARLEPAPTLSLGLLWRRDDPPPLLATLRTIATTLAPGPFAEV